MKKILIFILLFGSTTFAQEICDNGLDDDGDSFVDLNDTECDCEGIEGFSTLIPNPSFDDTVCCPYSIELDCAVDWIQASDGSTADYYHECGPDFWLGIEPHKPLPDGGEGFVGFYEGSPRSS
jgi:hypothetical protein